MSHAALLLSLGLQQPVLEQARSAAAPRVVGTHAESAISAGDDRARSGIADREAYGVLRAAHAPHDADERLLGAQPAGDGGIAAVAVVQRTLLDGDGGRVADLD